MAAEAVGTLFVGFQSFQIRVGLSQQAFALGLIPGTTSANACVASTVGARVLM